MPQIKFQNISVHYGEQPLLDRVSFNIEKNEHIAIIGRNGVGKSTLLKLIQGSITADSGNIERESQLCIYSMAQHVPQDLTGSVLDFITQAHRSNHDWESYQVDKIITQLRLDPDLLLKNASGGQIRRVLLAAALVNEPDILLLDEPTNHLDIDSIEWLENFLVNYQKTLIFITHDRSFMQKIAARIIEIDLGKLTSWQGDYQGFLKNKAIQLHAEAQQQKLFDKKLSEEEVWIRQGIKARRTRNEGRVRALEKMREQRAQRRQRQGSIQLQQTKADYAGKIVFEIENINIDHQNQSLVKNFSATIMRGDKVAIIGPNGCGKTSLIKVILGEEKPSSGHVKHGTQINVVYFDQHRDQLNLDATAIDNVGNGSQEIMINNQKKHIIGYLQEFLFTPQKSRSLVKTFSGGERNRLLLAKILSKPSNVLVLDEPTNDLDMETLDILDEYLVNYPGTLILVSHDRSLLNNVATSTIVFEEQGKLQEYIGGYDDWSRQRKQPSLPTKKSIKKNTHTGLTHEQRKELNKLPNMIEKLENKINLLEGEMSHNDFYQQDTDIIDNKTKQLKQLQTELQQKYERWEKLDSQI
ncbi:MAG: ATP-binding cassette domain-containing protein [Gammaproteobacteria bacterium]|nr:ATP-binding cassette domain-containing protein [Gammaproteobacteria bacterium]MCH9743582.1 ATP-binding cassette domain-containing protein [Gammaproteobacteria bacterium]